MKAQAVVFVVLAAAVGAPAASAGTATLIGGELRYIAAPGEKNFVTIFRPHASGGFRVSDTGGTVAPGAGCTTIDATEVSCGVAPPNLVVVALGDRGDTAFLGDHTADVSARLFGGGGDDSLSGHAGADTLVGGPGIDWLDGLGGPDFLQRAFGQRS